MHINYLQVQFFKYKKQKDAAEPQRNRTGSTRYSKQEV